MQIFKIAAVGVVTMIGAGVQATTQRPAPGETRLKITCDLIKKNVEEGTTENTLHPRSIYYKVIDRMNSYINKLSTPPPAEYLCVTVGSGVLTVSSSGTDVILARFPSSGNLTAFGLTPSVIKSIALPHNLEEWPTTALSGCTALETISVYGEEIDTPTLTVVHDHFADCSTLKHIQIPSSVAIGSGTQDVNVGSVFPHSLQSIIFPENTRSLESCILYACDQLASVDLSKCTNLTIIKSYAFYNCTKLTSLDFSRCTRLSSLGTKAIATKSGATSPIRRPLSIAFPFSLTHIASRNLCATYIEPIDHMSDATIIPYVLMWMGCTERPSDDFYACSEGFTINRLSTYVSIGKLTEIFVP